MTWQEHETVRESECPDCRRPLDSPASNICRFPGAHQGYTPWREEEPDLPLHQAILSGVIAVCTTVLLMWLAWLWFGG